MPNADTTPKRCKLIFENGSAAQAEISSALDGTTTCAIFMPELSLNRVEVVHDQTGQRVQADLREPRVLPGDVLNCAVEFLPYGQNFDDSWKSGDEIIVDFPIGVSARMTIRREIQSGHMVAGFSWPNVHKGSRVRLETPDEPPRTRIIRKFTPRWDGNNACHLMLEFAQERKWGSFFTYAALFGACVAALWALYSYLNPGDAKDKTTTITPTPPMVCVPATPYNVRSFYLQKDPRRFMGKVAHLPQPFMSFACPTPPPYDQANKTSDVSACEICFPQAYAKPGAAFKMDEGMLQSLFFQKDPQCFMDPVLPFKPSQETMRKALRVDLECQDYSFNGSMGCWDYSKCNIIMPNYETKPPAAK